ncbi:hypothetical protein VAMP_7420n354 [Candidatus Vampirococcus lugosii]|uniref:Uncharacterized protein n=1 Tax=Candidatus Vampirococcus lugosii TaxID=2789015 RepID=A0ABS5QMS9_9BACT|nr:hypothetical protein [Candidatus Vampirococcus lugosii]
MIIIISNNQYMFIFSILFNLKYKELRDYYNLKISGKIVQKLYISLTS